MLVAMDLHTDPNSNTARHWRRSKDRGRSYEKTLDAIHHQGQFTAGPRDAISPPGASHAQDARFHDAGTEHQNRLIGAVSPQRSQVSQLISLHDGSSHVGATHFA